MHEIFIYMNGLLGALFLVLCYTHWKLQNDQKLDAKLKAAEFELMLKGVAESHNGLTEAQLVLGNRLNEMNQILYGLQEKANQPRQFVRGPNG